MKPDKIGCLIIDRGDRPDFLKFALWQLERQTKKPDEILVFNEPPKSNKPDITYRYRMGCIELEKRGCNLIFWTENDDYYSPGYIETLYNLWIKHNRPQIIGINHTIYYNIFTQKWAYLEHPNHSSAMSMAVTPAINKITWGDDNYSYTDLHIWKKSGLKGISVNLDEPICIGIKHGKGLCGGGGHVVDWARFDKQDTGFEKLSKWVDSEALKFYSNMSMKNQYRFEKIKSIYPKPYLTIITRRMNGKRQELFKKHLESIARFNQLDFEQILIIDDKKLGMLEANRSFQYVTGMIEGEYVHLADDDDFFTNPDFISVIKKSTADVIFFKNKILTGDGDQIYPKPKSWGVRVPKRGQIGGSCFVVKKWVYEKYIHHFALPSFGDWNFITEVLKAPDVKDEWIDNLMFETGRVSHGSE